jgi:hypothetical protein
MSKNTMNDNDKYINELHDLADNITKKHRSIESICIKGLLVRDSLIAVKDSELDRKVRTAVLEKAVERCDELLDIAEILNRNSKIPDRRLPLRYDRHGNCFLWTKGKWGPYRILSTPQVGKKK